MPDMHKRAERLRALLEDARKFRDEALDDNEIDLDANPPVVPKRFAVIQYDGNECYLGTYDNVADANNGEAGEILGEVPWAPGEMMDLDTGIAYEPHVTVRFKPLRWTLKVSFSFTNAVSVIRFPTKQAARGYVRAMKDNDEVTVLEGPTDSMKEAA